MKLPFVMIIFDCNLHKIGKILAGIQKHRNTEIDTMRNG